MLSMCVGTSNPQEQFYDSGRASRGKSAEKMRLAVPINRKCSMISERNNRTVQSENAKCKHDGARLSMSNTKICNVIYRSSTPALTVSEKLLPFQISIFEIEDQGDGAQNSQRYPFFAIIDIYKRRLLFFTQVLTVSEILTFQVMKYSIPFDDEYINL